MEQIEPLAIIKENNHFFNQLKKIIYAISGFLELIIFLAIWVVIFRTNVYVGDFTRTEMITYIIFGNIIGLISGHFLHHVIVKEAYQKKSALLVYRPLKYFYHILLRGMIKSLMPFFMVLVFHLIVIFFFQKDFALNYDPRYWLLIAIMIILAFIIEYLLVYIVSLFAHWVIEAGQMHEILVRIKKFLAGNYFPLSLLPVGFLQISLFLPFAYSFFVPTELFLKKISLKQGWKGILIQLLWIILLYIIIRITWKKKHQAELEKNTTN